MANLNFQQPPRSISGGGGLVGGGRAVMAGGGAVGGPGGAGRVTPTAAAAAAFAAAAAPPPPSGAPPPSALSPAALMQAQRSASLAQQQRSVQERRTLMPNNTNSMVSVRGGIVLGGGSDSAPPLLDPAEFPSLTGRGAGGAGLAGGQGDQAHHHTVPPPGSKPYVGMVKQPLSEQSEFTMSSEDFPALPGTSAGGAGAVGTAAGGGGGAVGAGTMPEVPPPQPSNMAAPCPPSHQLLHTHNSQDYHHPSSDKPRHGIITHPDGKVTNIPGSMVANQFGIVGLLTFIRAAETDPDLVSLALGQDLTTLGLNLNSPDNLYLTFAGPWAEAPCRPQDIDYHVPPEYLINVSIREKLAPLKLNRYKEDLLFYLFYCFVGDVLQLAAASELYNREWRYHTEEKVWITQAPGLATLEKTGTYERGTYYYFDAINWRKVAKEFHLDYSKLEGRPQLPPHFVA